MSDVGWRADGIRRARAAGGVELELYRRPGFTGDLAVRRTSDGVYAEGFDTGSDPSEQEWTTARSVRGRGWSVLPRTGADAR